MWSCFEHLDAINMMLQSEFNLDIPSETFFFKHVCKWMMSFYFIWMYTYVFFLFTCNRVNGHIYWAEMRPTTYTAGSSSDMVRDASP